MRRYFGGREEVCDVCEGKVDRSCVGKKGSVIQGITAGKNLNRGGPEMKRASRDRMDSLEMCMHCRYCCTSTSNKYRHRL
uniref:Uncharacterized protein n=1 Tax=Onchocerca volvulus TaxID=6282 RepID=A0A8R1TJS3_ONCVO